jgi:hypothetical protein
LLAPKEQHPGNSQANGPYTRKASGERYVAHNISTEGVCDPA